MTELNANDLRALADYLDALAVQESETKLATSGGAGAVAFTVTGPEGGEVSCARREAEDGAPEYVLRVEVA